MKVPDWLTVVRGTAPLVVSIPHAGTAIPQSVEGTLRSFWLARKDADWWLDRIYAFAAEVGATVVMTAVSRTVIDVNRDPSGGSLYPGQATTGLCPHETFDGEPLYLDGAAPTDDVVAERTRTYFEPYHAALSTELARLRALHPRVVLYDCHSIRSRIPRLFSGQLPQFNIGTDDGRSCDAALAVAVEQVCDVSGHSRVTNGRFKGGYITRHYGQPASGVHAIQMELACRGYMREPADVGGDNWPAAYSEASAAPMQAVLRRVIDAASTWAAAVAAPAVTTGGAMARVIRAPRGARLTARSWQTEAPLRMLMNNLDPDVAERPADLVVYGGIGKAARTWQAFDAIVETLSTLGDDQTLLVQSGKPVGVFTTHRDAPRVLIANSNLVPHWGTWEHFHALDRQGLMMYGQMTAGSWIYIGSQGIVQGTYETFVEMARQHYGGDLSGRWILTAGLGGMGGAQPLAASMAGASMLAIECQQSRIDMRLRTGYVDVQATSLDDALARIERYGRERRAVSIALLGNAADLVPEIFRRGVRPHALTDQTSAHDPVNGYLPQGWTVEQWIERRASDPAGTAAAAKRSMAVHVEAMLAFKDAGVPTFDYGNNLRQMAKEAGVDRAFDFPGFVPAYIRPLFCRGVGPFRWVALSGDPEDIYKTDAAVKRLMPHDTHLHRWLDMARERIQFQGLPARICWVGLGDRHRLGLEFNRMVRDGDVSAPIVIGRDHLDSGSVASPNRETEAMKDGSDAVSDWPLLNALLNCASGATWVSIHHGGGVGIGYSQHAGVVIVCDGSVEADARLARVLWNDPASGVMRHADAGYDEAIACAHDHGLQLPMVSAPPPPGSGR